MQLRDHPRLYIWPPRLAAPLESDSPPLEESEEAILNKVEVRPPLAPKEGHNRYIWISVEYGGKSYFTTITTFRDPEFIDLLYQKLSNSVGQTMREIGDFAWEEWED